MNEATLISIHRRKRNGAMLANSSRRSRVSHRNNLVMAADLIALYINDNRISETKLATNQERNENLERLKSTTMTSDQNGKIRGSNIKNQLSVIAIVLINRRGFGIKVSKDGAENGYRNISNGIELLVRKLLTSLITLSDLRILTGSNGRILGKNLSNFLRHHKLPY